MKTIVLVALLATMGCSKKSGSDCDASINKGMDKFADTVKARGSNSPMQTAMLGVVDKLRSTFLARCHEDNWAPEPTACFGNVSSQKDVKECEAKLTEEQRTKLTSAVREIMMSSMRMPGNIPGHPQMLQGSAAPIGAPTGAPPPAGSGATPPAAGSGAAPGAAPAAGSGAAPAAGSGAAPAAGGW